PLGGAVAGERPPNGAVPASPNAGGPRSAPRNGGPSRRLAGASVGRPSRLGYPRRVRLAYHMLSTPVGLLFLARSPRGVRYLEYMDRKSLKRMIASHAAANPDAKWYPSWSEPKPVVEQIEMYFNGSLHEFEVPLDPIGTEFQQRVWKTLA